MTDTTAGRDRLDTFPKLLRHNAKAFASQVALREKDYGIWHPMTWAEFDQKVRTRALALRDLGIGRGDVVAIIGDNRPDWVISEIAVHAVGALSLGLYRDSLESEVAYLLTHSGTALVFAEDEEQVDKILNLGEAAANLKAIVYTDPRGMRKYDDPRLMKAEELDAAGARTARQRPSLYDEMIDSVSGEDVAVLCTTSGTTTHPKLVMLPAGRIIDHARKYLQFDPKGPDDQYVSVLPMPWIVEQVHVFGKALLCRMPVSFPEEPETLMADLREIGPTFLLMAPRVWEGIAADIRARMMDASWFKRRMFALALSINEKAAARNRRSWLADFLAFRALRDRLGFSRLRSAGTGGAALGPDTFRFFHALGVPLRQVYGQTELMGTYMLHRENDVDFDTVGVVIDPAIEVRIEAPDRQGVGEIVTRHPNRFAGYFKNEKSTAETMRDGWVHTGDAGYFDDKQHLVVIDRMADLAVMASGDRYSPQFLENKLKFSSYVAEAVTLGKGREYISALICIRYSIVSKWAERKQIPFTTYSDLSANPAVYRLIRDEVERINATLQPNQRIAKFVLLYKELDADDGELTRTRKVRRSVIEEKYGQIISAIYAGEPAIDIDTVITFQDGTNQRIRTRLKVETVETGMTGASGEQAA
ncbi:AMP-binding protein [Microbaculum marinum]|uniref:AMP-binding protein n=1 Tax=Microbaculum marinum TaxID=1764581 RepID=A0AAW9S4C5_9HYPH